jgi:hypothetical protein
VELRPGIVLGVAPRFHARSGWAERLRLNGGVERAHARFHPRRDWRPLAPEELAQLVDDAPAGADPLRASLLVVPAWLRAAWWDQVDRAGYERFASELLGFLRFKALPLPALCEVRVTVSRPGQTGTRLDPTTGDLSGLAPAPSVPGAADVAAVNLGDEATHVVLLNLPPATMGQMVCGRAGSSPTLPLVDLVPWFFEARSAYPLVRIRLDPGEGLWFPAGDVVHDGWTCEKRELDVVLTICGSPPSPVLRPSSPAAAPAPR